MRIGLSLVFLCFAYFQFSNPMQWTGFVPKAVSGVFGMSSVVLVMLNAWFELVAGLALITGFQTRIVSLLLALHLFGIAATIGFSPLGVRDIGLSIATLSIFLAGADFLTLDAWFAAKKSATVPNL